MGYSKPSVWKLVDQQHGVAVRWQLLEMGLSARSIQHRVATGRLHLVTRGVYAVGRPRLTRHGRWMAAVLSCGRDAALSHDDAGALWSIRPVIIAPVHVSVPAAIRRRRPGIVVHRRTNMEVTRRHGIPVTTPVCTLIDIAPRLSRDELEAAINEADKRDLVTVEALRSTLDDVASRPGVGVVDFYWPDLGLVVETHGWRYHRTPAQQSRDLRREHIHTAAGVTPLCFTHGQVWYQPGHVGAILGEVAGRLRLSKSPA